MRVRAMYLEDVCTLKELHEEQYPGQTMPDFSKNFWQTIVVEDDEGNIITAGGVRAIAKADIITDKKMSPHVRKTALIELLNAFLLTCRRVDQEELHAFVAYDGQDKNWCKALELVSFVENPDKRFVRVL